MPFTGFRQALSGVCKSLASLSLWQRPSAAVLPVTTPLPYRSNRTDRTNRLRIGTFNVQSLGSLYKQFETLPQDLRRYQIDILGLQETKLYELGRYEVGDYLLLTMPAQEERYGVGFAISPRVTPYLHRCWAHSDRIGILQMRLPHTGTINIVTAYAPHSGRPLAEVDTFYADLRDAMDQFPRRDITMVAGDFNAKLGQKTTGETFLGPHARGTRNRNGHLMAAFCDTYQLFATNTAFPKRAKNKTTWSQRQRTHCVYNQIDYVLCPQNCRRFCLDAQSWCNGVTRTSGYSHLQL